MELNLPEISLEGITLEDRKFNLHPQYPITRERMKKTMQQLRVKDGQKILLLIDCRGSMSPYESFINVFRKVVERKGKGNVKTFYFNNQPTVYEDISLLNEVEDVLFPTLDPIFKKIEPSEEGFLYEDQNGYKMVEIQEVLHDYATDALVIVVSDFGGTMDRYNLYRLYSTAVFLKTVSGYTPKCVCLNPLQRTWWERTHEVFKNNTATQIARHNPMYSLSSVKDLKAAVDVLNRGGKK